MKTYSIGIAALAAVLFVAGCGKSDSPEEATSAEAKTPEPQAEAKGVVTLNAEARRTAGIKSEGVAVRAVQERLQLPGTIAVPGNARAVVTPPVAGKVVRLFANVGDRVRRGQALAQIQSSDLALATSTISAAETSALQASAAVRQQAAAVDLARGRLRTALANLDRQRRFAATGAFSQPSLTAARNDLSEAQTEGAAAESDVAGAKSRLDRAERLSREGLVSKADLDQARLDLRQAQIRVERSGQRLALAQATLRREGSIGQQGLLNAREIQTAEAEARSAKLELDQARIQYQGAQSEVIGAQRAVRNARQNIAALRGDGGGRGSTVTLTAPISGVITERLGTIGQAVERSSDLFEVLDLSTVWVTASVPERSVARIRPGAQAWITMAAVVGRTYQGTVQVIGDKLDPKTRTLPVQCRVLNPGGLLRADMFAKVEIATGRSTSGIAVPLTALSQEGDDTYVFVDRGGTYEHRKVTVGGRDDRFALIAEGVANGDQVVTQGIFVLQSELRKSELQGDE